VEDDMDRQEMITVDTAAMPWEERYQALLGKSHYRKILVQDPDTGVEVRVHRYPAGYTTPWHTHTCAHGMYVLEGTLVTHAGSYSAGSFVWFPQGMMMEHGATAQRDVVVLFITNKKFDIHFAEAPGLPSAAPTPPSGSS
jgi:quercetin dioxygenase-like cupin family protein